MAAISAKMLGYILYAIGIVGGVEGAVVRSNQYYIAISVVALIVIIIASYLLDKQ